MASEVLDSLKNAILDLDMDAAVAAVKQLTADAAPTAAEQGVGGIAAALEIVGKRFQEGEWFVADLVYAGEITKAAMAVLAPLMAAGGAASRGKVVVGTVAGDLHDLGKNIFTSYAQGAGYEVIDLGIDVSKEKFAEAVSEHQPAVLGMSCLLTITAGEVTGTIEELRSRGLRADVKVLIGGAALTERFATEAGADGFAPDAVTGTDIINGWLAA